MGLEYADALIAAERAEAEPRDGAITCRDCWALPLRGCENRPARLWYCWRVEANVTEGSGACDKFSRRPDATAEAEPAKPDVWAVVGDNVIGLLDDIAREGACHSKYRERTIKIISEIALLTEGK